MAPDVKGLLDRHCERTGQDAALVRARLDGRAARREAAWYGAADGPREPPLPAGLTREQVEALVEVRLARLLADLPAAVTQLAKQALARRW